MSTYTFDCSSWDSVNAAHADLSAKLEFPDYYGNNLDALWDMLAGWIEGPVTIRLRNAAAVRNLLGPAGERMMALLLEADASIKGVHLRLD